LSCNEYGLSELEGGAEELNEGAITIIGDVWVRYDV